MKKHLLLILLLWGIRISANAQTGLYFQNWGVDDGLGSNTFTTFEDSNGLIWIGTLDGLVRFDSFTFEWIRAQDDDSLTIPSNPVPFISEGPTGNIWAGTRGGVGIINPVSLNVTARHAFKGAETLNNMVRADSIILIQSDFGLYAIDEQASLLHHREFKGEEVPYLLSETRAIQRRGENTYLIEYDWKQGFAFTDSVQVKGHNNVVFRAAKWKNDSTMFQLMEDGVLFERIFNLETGEVVSHQIADELSNTNIYHLAFEEDGSFWLGANPELYHFQKKGEYDYIKTVIPANKETSFGRKSVSFVNLFLDSADRLWINDNSTGLSMLDTRQLAFKYINPAKSGFPQFKTDMVWNVNEGDVGELLLGTGDGAIQYTLKSGANFQNFTFLRSAISKSILYKGGVTTTNILRQSNKKYFSFFFDGIYEYENGESEKLFPLGAFLAEKNKYSRNMTHAVLDEQHILWGAYSGVILQDTEHNTFTPINLKPESGEFYPFDVYGIEPFMDADKNWGAYLSTALGLLEYHYPDSVYRRVIPDSIHIERTGTTAMVSKVINGKVWTGYLEKGIEIWDPELGNMEFVNEDTGLSNEGILGLLEDHKGRVWVSHSVGISCIEPDSSYKVTNFYLQDGLRNSEYAQNAYQQLSDNYLAFGGHGVVIFHPDTVLKMKENRPRFVFNKLRFNRVGEEVPEPKFLISAKKISIDYRDNDFEVGFTELGYSESENVAYSYRIKGHQDDWTISSPNVRTAFINNISPGLYTLEVRTKRDTGDWELPALQLEIKVEPPFWLTRWFLSTMFFVGFSLIGFAAMKVSGLWYKRRIRKLEAEQKAMTEREQLSRDLHDSIGSQLSLIARHLEQVKSIEEEESKTRLEAANKTARYTISQLRETLWALKNEEVYLSRMAERLKELISRMILGTNMKLVTNFHISRDEKLQPIVILHVFRIVQEAINNAIKYSKGTEITLTIDAISSSKWSLKVADNGLGFNLEELDREEAYGLNHIMHRAEEIEAFAQLESTPDEGTSITLTFFR